MDDIANWRLQQENTLKPFPYVFPQMPPLDKRFIKIMAEQLDVIPFEFPEMFIDGFNLEQR